MKFVKIYLVIFFACTTIECLKIDRVILATDTKPMYIDFWPMVAQAWQDIVGVRPTLALIAPAGTQIDETVGDVIRFDPIPGVPTALHAQVIRLFLPAYFPDDVCILSDIDMLPLSKNYFIESVRHITDDHFVVYRDRADDWYIKNNRYPICYNVARGSVFMDIFDITDVAEIPHIIKKWNCLQIGWQTDEYMLSYCLNEWNKKTNKLIKLGHTVNRRIDRGNWAYDTKKLYKNYYIDSHMLRPYKDHKRQINKLLKELNIRLR
ncbi:MAG: hypothetical protein WC707_04085 [Candidatus Babeliaceae bacterium]|jgi:hypothetical protein